MNDPLPITPFTRPVRGDAAVPGSKSLTNRALLLAALSDGPVTLTGALFSEDTAVMATALGKLNVSITSDPAANTLRIQGQGGSIHANEAALDVRNAGTAARFLTALCAAAPRGVYRLDGVEQMRRRPMKGLIDALRALGADIRCPGEEGFFPIEIHARGLAGGPVTIDARESSQMLSALLLVAPLARRPVEVTLAGDVRRPFVTMTARLMEQFGQPPLAPLDGGRFTVPHGRTYHPPAGGVYAIEPDATAASYFLALPLVAGGALTLRGLRGPGGLQGDTAFADVLRTAGVTITETAAGLQAEFAAGAARRGVEQNFNAFSDTFLTIAALAPLLAGPTRITGIAHTRKQETDRVAGMARELCKLGQQVIESDDSLEIHPQPLQPAEIETYHDHRFAMSFAILGCHDLRGDGRPWLTIRDPGCCAKTFPQFFERLEALRRHALSG